MAKKICGNCFSTYKGALCPHCGHTEQRRRDDADALPVGTRLNDRYIVGRVIGKGGFGIIYLAYDEKDDKAVAIKEFFPGGAASRGNDSRTVEPMTTYQAEVYSEGLERFINEAELITKFAESAEILGIYEVFRENGTAYYSMEFVKGVSLKEYTERYGAITEGQAVYIAEKLLPALAVLHRENTLHRDVCPDNIMLCANGTVKLIDFGSARVLKDFTQSMTVILKPGFAPLEQYSQKGEQNGRTDIYSLGASLFFGLTLSAPDDPITRLDDDSAFQSKLKGLSAPLASLIAKATAIKAADRYANAREMQRDILSPELVPERFDAEKLNPSAAFDTVKRSDKARGARKLPIIIAAAAAVAVAALIIFLPRAEKDAGPRPVMIGSEEYMSDVSALDLSEKHLTNADIDNLRNMKELVFLNLDNNSITDLSCLSGLTKLEEIHFNNNSVSSIEFMRSMDNIRAVSGEYNKVSDLSPLAGKTELEEVFFGDNYITDITPLKDSRKLRSIGFNRCMIGDLETLRGMTELEMVCLQKCGIKSLEPLSDCRSLKYIYVGRNYISDVSPLKGCDIKELYADNNDLSSHSDTFSGLTVNGFIYVLDNGLTWAEVEQIKKTVNGDFQIYHI